MKPGILPLSEGPGDHYIRRCEDCGRVYCDVTRWTLCPHGPLDVSPGRYCAKHDLAKPYQPEAWKALGCPNHEKVEVQTPCGPRSDNTGFAP